MALYAFDGTWNSDKTGDDPTYTNTNVVRFYNAYRKNSGTQDFYVAGVGTRYDVVGRVMGGAFGLGELPRLNEAYDALCDRWTAGDRVIDIVGFSRGAATTLDFCHIIQDRGIREHGSGDVVEPAPKIRFLGVWDVVAAFGLANLGATDLNIGHHLELPKENLEYAFHALALDERRPSFIATRLTGAWEVWFRGVHSDVGGGNENRGLNDIALKWMMSKAKAAGLPITDTDIAALHPDPAATPDWSGENALFNIRLVGPTDRRHYTVAAAEGCRNTPDTCPVETEIDERVAVRIADRISVLPAAVRNVIAALWTVAQREADREEFPLDNVADALLTLIQGRAPLVTSDALLHDAAQSTADLVAQMIYIAKRDGLSRLDEHILAAALFQKTELFPYLP
jgi:hypothetical protein